MEIEKTCVSKNLDETVRIQFEERREWIREIRGERLQGIAEGANSTSRLAKTVPVRSDIEFEIRGNMEERTGWSAQNESQIVEEKRRNGRLVGATETSKERAKWRRLQ